ncbi:MAG: DNA polymerase III subunit beta, partial [Oscillospiraceae bacterium]|nr:DNA polymerase III subunit beta [Oscillospiraceae bacterium]
EEAEIIVGEKHVTFKSGNTRLVSRRLIGDYLNYRTAVPQTNKYELLVSRREIYDAVERVSLIINESKAQGAVRCVFGDGVLFLTTSTVVGSASDECAVTGDGEKLEIGFSKRYLLDTLKAAPADELRLALTSPEKPCVVTSGDAGDESFLYMILPVALGKGEARADA